MNDAADEPSGKGGPTRSRKEAEAARKQQMKRPLTRREQADRSRRQRDKQREALMGGGSAKDLPLRDQGPGRALARDVVDRRRTIAEFMLPILVVILVLSFFSQFQAFVFTLWTVTILLTVIDEVLLVVRLRRELSRRVADPARRKGATLYAVLRSTQLRRMRLPKPAIAIGGPLRETY